MSAKRNFWTQVWSAMNGALIFGGLSPSGGDVRSSVELKALDGRHFFDMTEDGERKGWTTINSPGAFQVGAGEDLGKEQNAIFMEADNGDVIIKARNGRVKIEGLNVEISATGVGREGHAKIHTNEDLTITGKNITINPKNSLKLITSGIMTLDGKLGIQILSSMVNGASSATNSRKKPGQIK
jgi:hypothetical protein